MLQKEESRAWQMQEVTPLEGDHKPNPKTSEKHKMMSFESSKHSSGRENTVDSISWLNID